MCALLLQLHLTRENEPVVPAFVLVRWGWDGFKGVRGGGWDGVVGRGGRGVGLG